MKRDVTPGEPAVPVVGSVDFGDFDRAAPIGRCYGFDRGQPIDRLYIERFLARHATDIRGRVLEIEDDRYTRRFGRDVTRSDVLHLHAGHPGATLAADLAHAPHLRAASFDCLIVTQTLQYVYDLRAALATVLRILAPGGTLLLSVPGLSRTSDPEWEDRWMWNFTSRSVARLLADCFDPARTAVEGHGNVLAAVAFLHGLAVEGVGVEPLLRTDAGFEVCITARAVR
jgi:SAM-dependent methyltransferase